MIYKIIILISQYVKTCKYKYFLNTNQENSLFSKAQTS